MKYPKISAKTITYGRVDFLEEALESFIKQDYPGEKEMIIVNDYPLQKLEYDHPEVKIYNLDYTFPTIGDKENFAVSKCSGDLIAVWDDDDIAMSNHMSNIAKFMDREDAHLLQWHKGVFFNDGKITSISGLGNSGIVYTKEIWEKIGGHPLENAGYDMTFVFKIRHNIDFVVYAEPPDAEASWFYMWGGRGYHMSGQGTDVPGKANVIQRHSTHVEHLRQLGKIPTGIIKLNPHWSMNYKKALDDYVKKG